MEYIINKSEPVMKYIKNKAIVINRILSEYSFVLLLFFAKIISKTIDYIINVLYLLQIFIHIIKFYILYKTLTIYDFIENKVLKIKSKFKWFRFKTYIKDELLTIANINSLKREIKFNKKTTKQEFVDRHKEKK